jgi:protein-S-isoprenylcysteine O-methyltransferase Ste14
MRELENRIPPPLLLLGLGAAMAFASGRGTGWPVDDAVRVPLAVLCALAGAAVNVAGFRALREAGTTFDPTRPESARVLVTHGAFARTRNPMYLGFALLLVGWAAWQPSPWALLGPAAFVAFVDRFQIRPEERALQARFGDAWARYRGSVRRWV